MASARESVVVCVQFGARTATDAADELRSILATLRTDFVDVLTFYYVERRPEWDQIRGPGGALGYCQAARRDGLVRRLGMTTHQRPLAAEAARSGSRSVRRCSATIHPRRSSERMALSASGNALAR